MCKLSRIGIRSIGNQLDSGPVLPQQSLLKVLFKNHHHLGLATAEEFPDLLFALQVAGRNESSPMKKSSGWP